MFDISIELFNNFREKIYKSYSIRVSPLRFLLKKSLDDLYLKLLDFSELLLRMPHLSTGSHSWFFSQTKFSLPILITLYKKNLETNPFHIWSVGYQNRVKRVSGVHFCWKICKNENFDFLNFSFEGARPENSKTEGLSLNP